MYNFGKKKNQKLMQKEKIIRKKIKIKTSNKNLKKIKKNQKRKGKILKLKKYANMMIKKSKN